MPGDKNGYRTPPFPWSAWKKYYMDKGCSAQKACTMAYRKWRAGKRIIPSC